MPILPSLRVISVAAEQLFCCPITTLGTLGADSLRPLSADTRPMIQKPFFSDQRKAKRLLHSLDLDGREIAPYLIEKLPLARAELCWTSVAGLELFPWLFVVVILACERPSSSIRVFFLWRALRSGSGYGEQSAGHRGGFFTACAATGIRYRICFQCPSRPRDRRKPLSAAEALSLSEPQGHLIVRDVFMSRDRTAHEWAALFSVLLLLHTPRGRCYAREEILGWLRQSGFARIKGPFRSSPVPFDPDSVLIAMKS